MSSLLFANDQWHVLEVNDGFVGNRARVLAANLLTYALHARRTCHFVAGLDSDKDGYPNGWELGDPCGVWIPKTHPVWISDISHPGNASSVPETHPLPLNWKGTCGYNPCVDFEVQQCCQRLEGMRDEAMKNDSIGSVSGAEMHQDDAGARLRGSASALELQQRDARKQQEALLLQLSDTIADDSTLLIATADEHR